MRDLPLPTFPIADLEATAAGWGRLRDVVIWLFAAPGSAALPARRDEPFVAQHPARARERDDLEQTPQRAARDGGHRLGDPALAGLVHGAIPGATRSRNLSAPV